ncbi:MAG: helix-hairpin-helix domain-containing protein [bacterium]
MKFSFSPSQKFLGFLLLLLVATGGGILIFRHLPRGAGGAGAPTVPPSATPIPAPRPTVANIKVHVSGEVKRPGILTLARGSRVIDAILLAGGTTSAADLARVRMAMKLKDGASVIVPAKKMKIKTVKKKTPRPPKKTAKKSKEGASPKVLREGEKIFINTASEENLRRLPGVGPELAAKIKEYRDSFGPFTSLEEVKSVPGLSGKKFEKIKRFIEI